MNGLSIKLELFSQFNSNCGYLVHYLTLSPESIQEHSLNDEYFE